MLPAAMPDSSDLPSDGPAAPPPLRVVADVVVPDATVRKRP